MKILFLIDNLSSGGAQRQMVTLTKLFKNRQMEVSFLLYAEKTGDFFKNELLKENIPVYNINSSSILSRILKIRNFIRKNNFDAVISFMDTPNLLNCLAAIGGKKWKVITSERSSMEWFFQSAKGKIYAHFYKYADALVCNSYNGESLWKKYFPKYSDKLKVIYNPVIQTEINSTYQPLKDGKLKIIVAASHQYLKNALGLAKAVALLETADKNKLKIEWYGKKKVSLGKTKAYEEVLDYIQTNNLSGIITFEEPVTKIAEKMKQADIVALFSKLEGLPNVICEAMMIGKPIIMTRVSDYSKLIDESNGFLCDWDQPESIKQAIVSALNLNENQLIGMGKNSKQKAIELFDAKRIADQWISCIEN